MLTKLHAYIPYFLTSRHFTCKKHRNSLFYGATFICLLFIRKNLFISTVCSTHVIFHFIMGHRERQRDIYLFTKQCFLTNFLTISWIFDEQRSIFDTLTYMHPSLHLETLTFSSVCLFCFVSLTSLKHVRPHCLFSNNSNF